MKRLLLILFSINFFVAAAVAQTFMLEGNVSSDEETLPGVSVIVKGSSQGVATDLDGNFSLRVKVGDTLEFSYIGYQKKTVKVKNQNKLFVTLVVDENSLDEVMVVGYGTVKKVTATGAVSAIKGAEIRRIPVSSVQNTLAGKLPGFFSQQRSGQPGKDASDFFIRGVSSLNSDGNKPLIMVDDVEYTYEQLSQINTNEIESISILKDASTTAIYGIKGANGVLVVKTRRGSQGAPQVNVRMETGMQTPVRTPDFLNSYQTAILVNEAYANDGLAPKFTREDVEKFRTGSSPYTHPDVDWYNEIFKDNAWQQNINVDVSGGSERLRYFASVGYFTQDGMVKDFGSKENDVNSNYFYHRFNFRTNLDFDVTKELNMRLDVTSRFMNINSPFGMNATSEIYDFNKVHPYSAPLLNPNGSYAYLSDISGFPATLNARLANSGYSRTRRNDNNILLGATWKLDFITPGLKANARVAYASIDETYRNVYRGSYPTYLYNPENDSYTINPDKTYDPSTWGVLAGTNNAEKNVDFQATLNYNRVFNEDHDVSSMLMWNRQSRTYESSASVPFNFESYTLSVGYKYKQKYLADINVAYNGTDRFGKDNRFGFFPAVGLGYVISEEPFLKDKFDNLDLLKLRTSYGIVGSDATSGNRYLYKQTYSQGSNVIFGSSNGGYSTYYEGDIGNSDVTWEKARKFDVGLELGLFHKWNLTVDYFYDHRYDQLATRGDISSMLGVGIAPSNVAKTMNQGFDGNLSFQTRIGNEVYFNSNFVFSYAKNKVLYKAEAQKTYPWLAETGHSIGQPFGYEWIGYYTPEDIALIKAGDATAPAVPNTDTPVQAGDLKYRDLNNDGTINDYDKKAIGKPNLPTTTLGWSFGGSWKGWSINVLFQGSFDYSFSVIGTGIEPFKSQFQPIHTYRWTEERYYAGEQIEFPRLTSNGSTVNSASAYMSDFWLIDAWYIRLKTIDLSYQVPKQVLPKFIENIRLYVNAYNMFTWTNYNKYQQDPEISSNTAGDAYMNQRVVNFGVQFTL